MSNLTDTRSTFMLEKAGAIVVTYVSWNAVGIADLPGLIDKVRTATSVLQATPGLPHWVGVA